MTKIKKGDFVKFIGEQDKEIDITAGGVYRVSRTTRSCCVVIIDDVGEENVINESMAELFVPPSPSDVAAAEYEEIINIQEIFND